MTRRQPSERRHEAPAKGVAPTRAGAWAVGSHATNGDRCGPYARGRVRCPIGHLCRDGGAAPTRAGAWPALTTSDLSLACGPYARGQGPAPAFGRPCQPAASLLAGHLSAARSGATAPRRATGSATLERSLERSQSRESAEPGENRNGYALLATRRIRGYYRSGTVRSALTTDPGHWIRGYYRSGTAGGASPPVEARRNVPARRGRPSSFRCPWRPGRREG